MTSRFLAALLAALTLGGQAIAAPPDCSDFETNQDMEPYDQRWCQALRFKASYLENGKFVEELPGRSSGRAENVSGRLTSTFTSFSSDIGGSVSFGRLQGFFRYRMAETSDSSYYGRKIRIEGQVSVGSGTLEIYSPIDVDLWQTAYALIDGTNFSAPPPEDGLIMKGYIVTRVEPGEGQPFSANLLPMGGDFLLSLYAVDGPVQDIQITLSDG